MIGWETCRHFFEQDGGLRDIYVCDTTIEDWRTTFELLRRDYDLEFLVDSSPRELPATVDEAFAIREEASPSLRWRIGEIVVLCHFFTTEEIEFDIDSREVTSQEALDQVFDFMKRVGDTLGKPVILNYENDRQPPLISYEPGRGEFAYCEWH
jgi:hypothetical protein